MSDVPCELLTVLGRLATSLEALAASREPEPMAEGVSPEVIYESSQFFRKAGIGASPTKTTLRREARKHKDVLLLGDKKIYMSGLGWFDVVKLSGCRATPDSQNG